jgi:acyl-CoA synthetase (AMP-forming)/AMP-acid ligase II
MLFENWRRVVRDHPSRKALYDVPSARSWTFAELDFAAENYPTQSGRVAFPQGDSPNFIFSVLSAWKNDVPVCPLEIGQLQPIIQGDLLPDVVHVKTTSASTGTARLVAFTAEQLQADCHNIVSTMGLTPEWPNLGVISLSHSYGFSNLVLPLLLEGIPLVLAGSSLPEAVRIAASGHENVCLAGVPALWRVWHKSGAIPQNVRLAISAGAPLPLALEHSIYEGAGLKVHNFYGSSECGGIAFDKTSKPRSESSCAGTALDNVPVSIASNGCLEVSGPAVGKGFFPVAEPSLADGVFRSADIAEIREGKIYLLGRASDQINVAGRKVLPEVIERRLAAHPAVVECVVFGVRETGHERGETIVACLATREIISADSLKQFLLAELPPWQVPRKWWFLEFIAPNRRGKLSRAEWRIAYLAEEAKRKQTP